LDEEAEVAHYIRRKSSVSAEEKQSDLFDIKRLVYSLSSGVSVSEIRDMFSIYSTRNCLQ